MVPNRSSLSCPALPLLDLIEAAHERLQKLGYSPHTCTNVRRIWKRLARFGNTDDFSQPLAEGFLVSLGVQVNRDGSWRATGAYQHQACAAVRMLIEFASGGSWWRRRITKIIELPDELESLLAGYQEHFLRNVGGSPRTLAKRAPYLRSFLGFVSRWLGTDLTGLQVRHISDFLAQRPGWGPATIAGRIGDLRSFCRYLFMSGLVPIDLSANLPTVRVPRDGRIPSVWTHAQVEALLATVDRASPRGKRDYAILLLACRLGMRSEDIRGLRLDDLDWSQSQIKTSQSKTARSLVLPMLEDVGQALIDYLRHGRPTSPYREVFLRANAPIEPLANNSALWNIMNKHRRRAGVELPPGASHGMHSLRHTVATRLLQAGTPLDTISEVLGHASVESTRIYTKVDIEALRSAALPVEEVPHA